MGRRKHDWYPTGSWLTEQLLNRVPSISGYILEPCVGDRAMSDVIWKSPRIKHIFTNDIDSSRFADSHFDARLPMLYENREFDWVITNPPFSDAMEILKQAHSHAKKGVAFLLRLSFLEPTHDRGEWLAANPPNYQITLPRYSFTGDGNTDSVTCAWFVWEKGNDKQVNIVVPREKKHA